MTDAQMIELMAQIEEDRHKTLKLAAELLRADSDAAWDKVIKVIQAAAAKVLAERDKPVES